MIFFENIINHPDDYLFFAYVLSVAHYVSGSLVMLVLGRIYCKNHLNVYARARGVGEMDLIPLPKWFVTKRVLLAFVPVVNTIMTFWHHRQLNKQYEQLNKDLPIYTS